ncbi:MAG: YceD family protein [Rhizobiaceae bacterium]
MTVEDISPFSYPVKVQSLPSKGRLETFEADDGVAHKIAKENQLIAVESFVATAHVTPWKRDGVSVSGKVSAKLVQHCAISGEPLNTAVEESFEMLFVPDGSKLAKPRRSNDREWVIDPECDDVPDTFTGGTIDLAGPWLEIFVLGLDPFARAEGAELAADAIEDVAESPFAALAQLKQ